MRVKQEKSDLGDLIEYVSDLGVCCSKYLYYYHPYRERWLKVTLWVLVETWPLISWKSVLELGPNKNLL